MLFKCDDFYNFRRIANGFVESKKQMFDYLKIDYAVIDFNNTLMFIFLIVT